MNKQSARLRVGVAGYRGYSGTELVRLLRRAGRDDVVLLDHREPDYDGPQYVSAAREEHAAANPEAVKGARLDVIFLATPHEVSVELVPGLLDCGVRVVDLSGAFRLATIEHVARWYRGLAPAAEILLEARYGLPEFYRDKIRGCRFVSNPGCYPTAANLALRPLVEAGLIDRTRGVVCDAKSGVSGAGRKPSLPTSFCEVSGNLSAYAVLEHRHVPEVLMHSGLAEEEFSFTAQLVPVERGILETIYFRGVTGTTSARVLNAFMERYRDEPFIRLHNPGSLPDLRMVARTNFCDIGFRFDEKTGRGVVVSAIDNLVKGAAGQAIQNMNLMVGRGETEGLL